MEAGSRGGDDHEGRARSGVVTAATVVGVALVGGLAVVEQFAVGVVGVFARLVLFVAVGSLILVGSRVRPCRS